MTIDRLKGTRTDVLLSLLEGPKNIQELVASLDKRDTAIHQEIKPLIGEGIIEKDGAKYRLSHLGRVHAMLLHSTVSGLAVINTNRGFWQSHDLSSIPDSLLAKIGMLQDCSCVQDNPTDLLRSQAFFLEHVSQAKRIWGVSPIIAPGYVEMISGLLAGGAVVDLILTTAIIEKISPDVIESWLKCENFILYEIEEAGAAFVVTEECLFMGLFKSDGDYDKDQDLVCRGAGAVAWGRELWKGYRERAKVVR